MAQVDGYGPVPGSADDDAAPLEFAVRALCSYDSIALRALLAPGARLSLPPLRLTVTGADDVAQALFSAIYAFDELRYDLRSRYLTPGSATDEATLSGLHARSLFGARPTGMPGTVTLRLIATHDGRQLTRLDVWPDVAAIRALSDDLAEVIDARVAGSAARMVAELRSTIPAAPTRIVHGSARETPSPAPSSAPSTGAGDAARRERTSPSRTEGLKVPVPHRVKRRRAAAAGTVMLLTAAGLVAWVAQGALSSGGNGTLAVTRLATPSAAPTTQPTSTPTPSTLARAVRPTLEAGLVPTPTPTPPPLKFTNNKLDIPTDILFDPNKSQLRPEALKRLDAVVTLIVHDRRFGPIVVKGYTDDTGTTARNLTLSMDRATAVATYLRSKLASHGVSITPHGFGEAYATQGGDAAQRQLDRKVSIQVSGIGTPAPTHS